MGLTAVVDEFEPETILAGPFLRRMAGPTVFWESCMRVFEEWLANQNL